MLVLSTILYGLPARKSAAEPSSTPILLALSSLVCTVFFLVAVITNELVYYNNTSLPAYWSQQILQTSPNYGKNWNLDHNKVTRGVWRQCATYTNYTDGIVKYALFALFAFVPLD